MLYSAFPKRKLCLSKIQSFKKRSFCDKYFYSYNNRLTDETWDLVYKTDSTQLAFTRFEGLINQHFEYNFKMQSHNKLQKPSSLDDSSTHYSISNPKTKQNLTTTTKLTTC